MRGVRCRTPSIWHRRTSGDTFALHLPPSCSDIMDVLPRRASVLAALIVAAAACGEPTAPRDTEPPIDGTPVALGSCERPMRWVGYQVGDGPWRQAVPRAEGGVTFGVGATGALAWVETLNPEVPFPGFHTTVIHGTGAELTAIAEGFSAQWCPAAKKSVQLSTSVAGLREFEQVLAYLPDTNVFKLWHDAPALTLATRPAAATDLVAVRSDRSAGMWPVDVIVRRGIDLRAATAIAPLDFAGAEPLPVVARDIPFTGSPDHQHAMMIYLRTANGTRAALGSSVLHDDHVTVPQVSASALAAGDLHEARVRQGVEAVATRSWHTRELGPGPRLAGPPMACPTIAVLTSTAPHRMRVRIPVQAEYDRFARADIGPAFRRVTVIRTRAVRQGASEWDLVIPDFGTSSGYVGGFGLDAPELGTLNLLVEAGSALLASELKPREGLVVSAAHRNALALDATCPAFPLVPGP